MDLAALTAAMDQTSGGVCWKVVLPLERLGEALMGVAGRYGLEIGGRGLGDARD